MFFPALWLTVWWGGGFVMFLYVSTIVLGLVHRAYTKRLRSRGFYQFSESLGVPFLVHIKPDMPDGLAYRLTAVIFLAVGVLVFLINQGAGAWLVLGAVGYAAATQEMLSYLEEERYKRQDETLRSVNQQLDTEQQRVREVGRDATALRVEQEQGAVSQGPTRVREILPEREVPALPQEHAKAAPAQTRQRDYGDLLDDDEDERVV